MECFDYYSCWSSDPASNKWFMPPRFPPPPPIPDFVSSDVNSYLKNKNFTLGYEDHCDLCDWAGASSAFANGYGQSTLPLGTLLAIVALVSAVCGALLTATCLSIKRLRVKRLERGTAPTSSVRHLSRKYNGALRSIPSSSSTFAPSLSLAENTYCEGPYAFGDGAKEPNQSTSNIYAELHTGISSSCGTMNSVMSRPPMPTPMENCYLELNDVPHTLRYEKCGRGTLLPNNHAHMFPSGSLYYSDLNDYHLDTAMKN